MNVDNESFSDVIIETFHLGISEIKNSFKTVPTCSIFSGEQSDLIIEFIYTWYWLEESETNYIDNLKLNKEHC